jgi:hypothetical protein
MTFLQKIQHPLFWKNVLKVTLPFFVMVTLISLLMNNWQDIFSGDFNKINTSNFTNGKWIRFWSTKIVISLFYGIWMTNKKME